MRLLIVLLCVLVVGYVLVSGASPMHDVNRLFVLGIPGPDITSEVTEMLDSGIGGLILFQRNYASYEQFLALTKHLKQRAGRPLLLGVNHEGGRIQHFSPPFTDLPSMQLIGALNSTQVASDFGTLAGAELRAANIDVNFAPVVDVNTNPLNPVIGDRALGDTPALVAQLGEAIVAGIQSSGVAACLKHFPGHGDTSVDSHLELPFVRLPLKELRTTHFRPFADIIRSASAPAAVMTSHIVYPEIDPAQPATMSPMLLQDLLRKEFGFQGLIFSDSMEMNAIAKEGNAFEDAIAAAVNAGVDMLLVPHNPLFQRRAVIALQNAVRKGIVPRSRIREANLRIDALFAQYVKPPVADGVAAQVIGSEKHRAMRATWRMPQELAQQAAKDWKGNEL